MLALKINITKFINQEERDRIFKYSKSLAECYNLALNELKANNDFTAIHPLTKKFQNEHKEIYSKHAQNCGRDAISAVKSFFKLRKVEPTAKYPKHNRKYSTITLDANKQKVTNKDGLTHINFCGGFKFIEDKVIKFTYPQMLLDLSSCNYFDSTKINKESIKQIVLTINDGKIYACFVYSEPKKEDKQLNNEFIAIDLGISAIASIYSSKGECFKYQTKRMKALEKNKDKIKSKLDRKKKYSKHWNNEADRQSYIDKRTDDFLWGVATRSGTIGSPIAFAVDFADTMGWKQSFRTTSGSSRYANNGDLITTAARGVAQSPALETLSLMLQNTYGYYDTGLTQENIKDTAKIYIPANNNYFMAGVLNNMIESFDIPEK